MSQAGQLVTTLVAPAAFTLAMLAFITWANCSHLPATSIGVAFTYLRTKELCCATPMLVAGKWEQFAQVMKANIANVKAAGATKVVTSCPACDMMWRHAYPEWAENEGIEYGITVQHYSEIVSEKIAAGEFTFPAAEKGAKKQKLTWHDSCHMGRVSGVYEPPRELIKANPNADFRELPFNREEAHCCGSVLTLLKLSL